MILNAKMLSGNRVKDSEVVLLSGLSRSVKENERPVQGGRTELTLKIKCKQVLSVQCSFFDALFDLE